MQNSQQGIRADVSADRSQFFNDLTTSFYGATRKGAKISQGIRDAFWMQGMTGGLKNQFDYIEAFSETTFTRDLKRIDMPILIIHGDDDQIVPINALAKLSSKLVKNATLKLFWRITRSGKQRKNIAAIPVNFRGPTQ